MIVQANNFKEFSVVDVKNYFINALIQENFVIDKTGAKTLEWIGASFIADQDSIFGAPNIDYISHEIYWYESQSTNINDIYADGRKPPAAWEYAADKDGNINSNYGKLIFSDKYYQQYNYVIKELLSNPDGRRAEMIYNRPSMWEEYNKNNMNDFICTNAVTYFIRDHKVHCVVQMRSNDVVFGYKNDIAWQKYILNSIVEEINISAPHYDVYNGDIYWQVQNLHIYEKHFKFIDI